jgi:hypothetical protein
MDKTVAEVRSCEVGAILMLLLNATTMEFTKSARSQRHA